MPRHEDHHQRGQGDEQTEDQQQATESHEPGRDRVSGGELLEKFANGEGNFIRVTASDGSARKQPLIFVVSDDQRVEGLVAHPSDHDEVV